MPSKEAAASLSEDLLRGADGVRFVYVAATHVFVAGAHRPLLKVAQRVNVPPPAHEQPSRIRPAAAATRRAERVLHRMVLMRWRNDLGHHGIRGMRDASEGAGKIIGVW